MTSDIKYWPMGIKFLMIQILLFVLFSQTITREPYMNRTVVGKNFLVLSLKIYEKWL